MKFIGTLTIRDLGVSIPVQIDVDPETMPVPDPETIDEATLRLRWRRSARTIKRLRDQGRLPYLRPSPRTYLYRLADVRVYEAAHYRGADRRAVRKAEAKGVA